MTRREALVSALSTAVGAIVPTPQPERFWPAGTKEVYRWEPGQSQGWVPVLMQHLKSGDHFKVVDKEGKVTVHWSVADPESRPDLGEGRYGIMALDAPYVLDMTS